MSFLALSPMQAAVLLGLTAAAVVGLYLLKPPPRRVVVPSGLIWKRLLRERKRSSLIDRLRWWISLLIALLVGLGVAMALGRPELGSVSGASRRIVVVVDTSPTMRALSADGFSRFDHAVARARRLLMQGGEGSEYLVADTAGQVAATRFHDRRTALETLESLVPVPSGPVRFPRLDTGEAELYLVSDGVLVQDVPPEAEVVSVFQAADNVAITAFEIRPVPADPSGYEAFLEVVNTSSAPKDVTLRVSGVGNQRLESTTTLEPGQALGESVDLADFGRGAVRASVSTSGDALEVDDVAFSYLPGRQRRRLVLVTRDSLFLETVLLLDPRVELVKVRPRDYVENPPPADVYVFDRYAPPTPPAAPALLIRPPEVPWLFPFAGVVEDPPTGASLRAHPLLDSVAFDDLDVEEAVRVDVGRRPVEGILASAGTPEVVLGTVEMPLILALDNPLKLVWTTFDLDRSNFPLQPGFPIFLANAITWAIDEQLALPRSPGRIEVPLAGARVTGLDGRQMVSWELLDRTVFEAREPGLYTASRDDRRIHVAVNTADRRLSEINRTSLPPEQQESLLGSLAPGDGYGLLDELWMALLTIAVVLVVGEWWTYHRRWTV